MTQENNLVFVGEKRSPMAIKKGWTWETGHLAGRQLFTALREIGIEPEKQRYLNLWNDDGTKTLANIPEGRIVGMGSRVCRELKRMGIDHIGIVHPAARGEIRRRENYVRHLRERLTNGP